VTPVARAVVVPTPAGYRDAEIDAIAWIPR
jgi:hypothetical protein